MSFGDRLTRFDEHIRVAGPEQAWEQLKIGAGPPPVRTADGWLLLYHGVSGRITAGTDLQQSVRYSAGAMLLDADEVWRVVERTDVGGSAPTVVAPPARPARRDGTADVYYGMADSRIGVARLTPVEEAGRSTPPRETNTQP